MRKFQQIDAQALKAFYFAAIHQNFTRASEAAALTQSGISQHIARLEDELGVILFKRVGKKVLLTAEGVQLKIYAERYLDEVESLLTKMGNAVQKLEGEVSYAMPASCLMTPHFPLLLNAHQDFNAVVLNVNICHSQDVIQKLLEGEIDFGFVTRECIHRDILAREFAREEYVLVGNKKKDFEHLNLEDLVQHAFINYPGMDTLYELWMNQPGMSKRTPQFHALKKSGMINDLAAAITMCQHGIGWGIFPKHCVDLALKNKQLYQFKNKQIMTYPIYLVQLKTYKPLARVERVMDEFWKMKRS